MLTATQCAAACITWAKRLGVNNAAHSQPIEPSQLHHRCACKHVARCHCHMYTTRNERNEDEAEKWKPYMHNNKQKATRPTASASPTPASQGLPSFFYFVRVGYLAAQHRRLPNGGGQQQAQRCRAQNRWLAAPRETRTSRPPGGEGGRRHTLPAKEGHALAPPGLPIAQRQHTSAWQRWKKQRRKTANIRSGLVRGPALIEGKRLETRGIKVRPRCWQPTAT